VLAAGKRALDRRLLVSIAWRPNETSHIGIGVYAQESRQTVDLRCNRNTDFSFTRVSRAGQRRQEDSNAAA